MAQTGLWVDLKYQHSATATCQNRELVHDKEGRVFPLVTQAGEAFDQCQDLVLDIVVIGFGSGLDASLLYFHHQVYNGMILDPPVQTPYPESNETHALNNL